MLNTHCTVANCDSIASLFMVLLKFKFIHVTRQEVQKRLILTLDAFINICCMRGPLCEAIIKDASFRSVFHELEDRHSQSYELRCKLLLLSAHAKFVTTSEYLWNSAALIALPTSSGLCTAASKQLCCFTTVADIDTLSAVARHDVVPLLLADLNVSRNSEFIIAITTVFLRCLSLCTPERYNCLIDNGLLSHIARVLVVQRDEYPLCLIALRSVNIAFSEAISSYHYRDRVRMFSEQLVALRNEKISFNYNVWSCVDLMQNDSDLKMEAEILLTHQI